MKNTAISFATGKTFAPKATKQVKISFATGKQF